MSFVRRKVRQQFIWQSFEQGRYPVVNVNLPAKFKGQVQAQICKFRENSLVRERLAGKRQASLVTTGNGVFISQYSCQRAHHWHWSASISTCKLVATRMLSLIWYDSYAWERIICIYSFTQTLSWVSLKSFVFAILYVLST